VISEAGEKTIKTDGDDANKKQKRKELKAKIASLKKSIEEQITSRKLLEQKVSDVKKEIQELRARQDNSKTENFQVPTSGTALSPSGKCGELESKQGSKKNAWIKQYFALDPENHLLKCYEDATRSRLVCDIELTDAEIYSTVEVSGTVKPLYFNIRTSSCDFLLRTRSEEDKNVWVQQLRANCRRSENNSSPKKTNTETKTKFLGKTLDEKRMETEKQNKTKQKTEKHV